MTPPGSLFAPLETPEERRRRLGLAPLSTDATALPMTPKVRVAFGNKGLSGVTPPSQLVPQNIPRVGVGFGNQGLSGVTPPPQPMAGGVRLPSVPDVDATGAPSLPDRPYTPPPIRVRVGADTTGLNPLDRNIAVLDAQRQAAQDFPSSKVSSTGEIAPPKMHHGVKDRLGSIGKGALLGLERGGPVGAIIGAVTGGVSPVTIDKQIAQRALARKTAEVEQQLGVEHGRAQVGYEQARPVLEAAKIQSEAQDREARQEIARQAEQGRISRAEANRQLKEIEDAALERHRRELERQGQARVAQGQARLNRPGAGDIVSARQEAQRQRRHDAAQREYASLIEGEKNAEAEKNRAYDEYSKLQGQYARQTDRDARAALKPQLDAAKKRADDAQALYAGFGAKKTKAQKDIDENAPSATSASQAGGPTPATHGFSIKGWMARNPGKTEADARAYHDANYASYPIVP